MDSRTHQVAQQLVDGLRAQLPAKGFRLDGIEVLLGASIDLISEELKAALQLLLPGVEIKMTAVEILMKCVDCGAEFPPEEHPCPVCGSPRADMIHGEELEISRAWGETVGPTA